jgi:hypothetical protein
VNVEARGKATCAIRSPHPGRMVPGCNEVSAGALTATIQMMWYILYYRHNR